MNDDVFVREIPMLPHIRGVTVPNDDGTFSIYINASLSEEARREALEHEIYHIRHDHLYQSELHVSSCERNAVARPEEKPSPMPSQPPREAASAPSVPEPAPQQRKPTAPRWGFVRRGYLILWDEVQPGDVICKPPRNQPKDDPHCPRILAPVPKRPRARRCEVDIWK